ncbi:Crp/Fnr family transcriptional regulator [Arenicella xantha]|uniref:CRP-like cAMP-binding protein n=1 Tax=Arenicella xantha TaxID=644221 RepID=A0A395JNB1_9GAMM|nr:Crp/Fnr family transcriptional regulator [Arenicella xantha]RBP51088.1 CRP-like cAMP-binding protein [Arenicella xantha]
MQSPVDSFPELYKFLKTFHDIPESLLSVAGLSINKVLLKKGEHLLKVGQPSGKAGFVVNGLCRQYYLAEDGKEFTKYFQPPGLVAIAFAEVIRGVPARCCIQAVTDTELYVMTHPDFWSLFDIDLDTNILGKKIAERFFVEKDQREYEFLHFDAAQRYRAFQQKYGEFEHLIPKYQIASYIGITAVSLSRLLTKPSTE